MRHPSLSCQKGKQCKPTKNRQTYKLQVVGGTHELLSAKAQGHSSNITRIAKEWSQITKLHMGHHHMGHGHERRSQPKHEVQTEIK